MKKKSTTSKEEKRDQRPTDKATKLPKSREVKVLLDEELIVVTGGLGNWTMTDQI